MPTYDYECGRCGGFDALRRLSQRDEPAPCPACDAASPRVFAHASGLVLMAGATRTAIETNERARHEPKSSRDYARLKHPSGCGCCSGDGASRRGATVTAPNGAKAAPSRRPWMISH